MSKVFRSYKVEVDPNNVQKTLFWKNCGASRWAYNWALGKKKVAFEKKERIPNFYELVRELTKIKGTAELPWAWEVSCRSFTYGLQACESAFDNFFLRCRKKVKGKKGFPRFKSRKNSKSTFSLDTTVHLVGDSHIHIMKVGKVRLKERGYIPVDTLIKSATVSERGCRWYVSCMVEVEVDKLPKLNNVVGVDLGIKTLATCSNGKTFENPKALKKNLKRLKRKQRELCRKKNGSKNREKARLRLSKLHSRVGNIRRDTLHKVTTGIIRESQTIVLENLKVSNMLRNHWLAGALGDVGLFEFRKMIEYKARWYGREVVLADTYYPSSKTCSCCGWKNDKLTLKDRVFKCGVCGSEMDRDMNAAVNLSNLGKSTVGSTGIKAFGEGSSVGLETVQHSLSEKKEYNIECATVVR